MATIGRERKVDPITLEVIRGGLVSLCAEMGIAMERSSYSPIFSEGLDYSFAMFDRKAEMISQAAFDPCHLGAMPYSVRASVNEIGIENLEPGDVILHNDPFNGGSHISDFTAATPVFYKGEIVAMPAARGHQIDSGAMVPGGFAGDAQDIFQEGLRIPPIKINSRNREVQDAWKLILGNVRLPKAVQGDLRAMFGALSVSEKRIQRYLEKYSPPTWSDCMEEIKNISERIMRSEIQKIPSGTYEYEDYADDTGRSENPPKIHVRIEVRRDEIFADFTGSSRQVDSPINAAFAVTAGNTVIGVLHSIEIGGDYIVNQGTFRPIRIFSPKGTLVNPEFPAPVQGGNTELSNRVADTVIGALAQAAMPTRIKAACHGTDYGMTVGGIDHRSGEPYVIYMWSLGGMGARAAGDGNCAQLPFATNNKGMFIEINEIRYPILFEEYALYAQDTAAPGKFRGGIGTRLVWRLLADECELSCLSERHKISPYGVFGGFPPLPRDCGHFSDTRFMLNGQTSFSHATELFHKISPSKWSNVTIHKGDRVEIFLSSGGGWGSPLDRSPEAVLSDITEGYLTVSGARDEYGVVAIDSDNKIVDERSTEQIRCDRKWPNISFNPKVKMVLTFVLTLAHGSSDNSIAQRFQPDSIRSSLRNVVAAIKLPSDRVVVKLEAKSSDEVVSCIEELWSLVPAKEVLLLTSQFVPSETTLP